MEQTVKEIWSYLIIQIKILIKDLLWCTITSITIADKSIDEEEYILFQMHREKMVGGNFRDDSMEVAFEL